MTHTEIFRRLIRLRLVEEAIAGEYPKQEMRCPVHLCLGQEGVAVGAASALAPGDALLGTHRSHGPYVASGGDIEAMLAEIYGKENGCSRGKGGSMHLVSMETGFWGAVPIVGSSLPVATGVALAFKMRAVDRVGMVLFGEGASEEGVFHESLQYAALKKLPIVYVCENNRFSVNTPWLERRPENFSISGLAQSYGIESHEGDGNDVFAVHRLCSEAVDRARSGDGPVFLEFETYRMMEHCGPYDDHHLPCRSESDRLAWLKRCPVELAKKFLLGRNLATAEQLARIREEEETMIIKALRTAKEGAFPPADSGAEPVYAKEEPCAN